MSFFRIILIPVYVTIYLNADAPMDYYIAGGILAISCLTDAIDGQIARRFNMITTLGKILDPLADKLTQFSLIMCLAFRYHFLWYVIALFVMKELFQLIAGSCQLLRNGTMLKGALISGKICTTVLFISLIALVIFPQMNLTAVKAIAIVDSLFLLLAFADYLITYIIKTWKFQPIESQNSINNKNRS